MDIVMNICSRYTSGEKILKKLFYSLGILLFSGCGVFQSVATDSLMSTLASAEKSIQQSENYYVVEQAMPTFIVMVDAFLADNPDDIDLLLQAAKLHTAYGLSYAQPENPEWAQLHYRQAYEYIEHCIELKYGLKISKVPFPQLEQTLHHLPNDSLVYLFWLAMSWGSYINTNRDDTDCMASLPYIEIILQRILELDEYYENGMAHLCMGIFYGMSATTGDKAKSQMHFEKILKHTKRQLYLVHVTYAKTFAYTFQDQELFEKLLEEVIDGWENRNYEPFASEFTLSNAIAYKQALLLEEQIEDYFPSFAGASEDEGEDNDEEW